MSFTEVAPQQLAAATADIAGIGTLLRNANAAAATSTTNVLAAAHDEVSTAIAALFGHRPCRSKRGRLCLSSQIETKSPLLLTIAPGNDLALRRPLSVRRLTVIQPAKTRLTCAF